MKKINILLLWHALGHPNLGVDALGRAHIRLLNLACISAKVEPVFTIIGFGEKIVMSDLDAAVDVRLGRPLSMRTLIFGSADFRRAVADSDIILDIGEGDSFSDIYGFKRFAFHFLSKLRAVSSPTPLILAPQTIGPFNSIWSRIGAGALLSRFHGVCTRDVLSTEYVESSFPGVKVIEFTDVAFALPYRTVTGLDKTSRVNVGVNVSGLLYRADNGISFGMSLNYRQFIDRLIKWLTEQDGVEVHLIAHVVGGVTGDDDWGICNSLANQYKGAVIAPRFEHSVAAKSYISQLNLLYAARMHACIAALSAGVAVVPISYSRKFNGLFGTIGYKTIIDGRTTDVNAAFSAAISHFEDREILRLDAKASAKNAELRVLAYQEYLTALLGTL